VTSPVSRLVLAGHVAGGTTAYGKLARSGGLAVDLTPRSVALSGAPRACSVR